MAANTQRRIPFALTIPGVSSTASTDFAKTLIDQFKSIVETVVGFYFGSEAVIQGIKLYATCMNPGSAAAIARADRDLPAKPRTPSATG